jgi:DedD protein
MDSVKDTEITLGTAKLLGLFFGLVMVCAVFFALGYTLGRKSESGLSAASAAVPLSTAANRAKPAGAAASGTPMTFYKSVEQKDASAQLTPAVGGAPGESTAAGQTPTSD